MKTSSRIFWGFWGVAALLVLAFVAAAADITRSWVSPDGRILRSAESLTGPWENRDVPVEAFSKLRLEGAFDVQWESFDTPALTVSAPRRFQEAYSVHREGEVLVLRSHLSGRFADLALRVTVKSPSLSDVAAQKSLKLRLSGYPGDALRVAGREAVWLEGKCPKPLERLELRVRGLTMLRMAECKVQDLHLEADGRVEIHADVTGRLEGRVHGDGRIQLKESPAHSRLSTFGNVQWIEP